jgi:DNA polymerase (family 10)
MMNRDMATRVIGWIGPLLRPWEFHIAGSYRRGKEELGDIDIISLGPHDDVNHLIEDAVKKHPEEFGIIEKGKQKTSFVVKGHQVDIRFTDTAHLGTMLLYFTGSKAFNIRLRSIAKNQGLKLTEYGLFPREGPGGTIFSDEKDVFAALGLQFTAPFLRNGRGTVRKKVR